MNAPIPRDSDVSFKRHKQPPNDAVHEIMHKTLRPGDGGLIALGADGTIVMDYSTGGMARAAANASGHREVKIGK